MVEHLAEQLEIEDVSCVKEYTERLKTVYEHAWEIRDAYGYHPYEDHDQGRRFRAFLHGQAWTAHAEGPKALFDHAVGWLRRHRVLLPGVSVLARQVAEVRAVADRRLHATVAKEVRRADAALPRDLVATLKTPEGKRYSELERMRRPPTRTTGTAMKGALQRVEDLASFQLGRVKLDKIPPNRLSALARYGLGTKAAKLERTTAPSAATWPCCANLAWSSGRGPADPCATSAPLWAGLWQATERSHRWRAGSQPMRANAKQVERQAPGSPAMQERRQRRYRLEVSEVPSTRLSASWHGKPSARP